MTDENQAKDIGHAARVVADAYASSPTASSTQWQDAAQQLARLVERIPEEYRGPLRYHQARFLARGEDFTRAIRTLDQCLAGRQVLPEAIWLKIQLTASGTSDEQNRLRWRYEDQLAKMLPISPWSALRDARLESRDAAMLGLPMRDAPRPTIPQIDPRNLLGIARLFESMNMTADTARTYREAIYGGLNSPGFPECGSETWISVEATETWMKIARCEAATGKRKWALQALLMAVAGSSKQQPAANALLQRMFDDEADELVTAERSPDAQKLTEIAELYRSCNLHPRAVDALDQAARIPDTDVSKLRSEIESEWKELIAKYASAREQTCFLFGRQVAKTANPMDLSPASFSY